MARWRESLDLWTAVTLIVLVAALSVWEARRHADTARWVERTHRVIDALANLRGAFAEAEDARRGFALTGDAASLRSYDPGRVVALASSLRTQTADNPRHQRRLERLVPLLAHRIAMLDAAIGRRRADGFDPLRESSSVREGDEVTAALRAVVTAMEAEERALLVDRERQTDRSVTYGIAVRAIGIFTSCLILVAAFARLRREVGRRARSERAARRREEDLAITLRSIGDGVIATDDHGRVERMNPVAERLTGWRSAGAAGRPFTEVCRLVHETTREPAVDPIARVLREGVVVGLANHTVLIARDGTEIPIADSAAPIRNDAGQLVGVVLVFRDVTAEYAAAQALRNSEASNRSIIESSPDCLKLLSLDGELLEMAPVACRIMEVDDFRAIERADWLTFWKGDEQAQARVAVAAARDGGHGHFQGFCPTLKGTPKWWDVAISPILGSDGVPVKLLAVSRDITESKRKDDELRTTTTQVHLLNAALEARVVERTSELVEANVRLEREIAEGRRTAEALTRSEEQFRQSQKMESIGLLAGGIAHDFNNLLSVILGYGELLMAAPNLDDAVRGDLQQITKAGGRAADMTRQLLAFSRQQVLAPRVVDLNAVLTGMEGMLARLLGADVELKTIARRGLGKVLVDPGQMEQVVMNLVVNARDAMPRGGTLTVETGNVELDAAYAAEHVEASPGPHVMLAVTDTGTGMDAETRARIFEPFFTTKEKGKGTGLGLSTVFGIVRQSGGTVWVYSELGHGTTFKVYLPRTRESGTSSDVLAASDKSPRGSETILLTEDDESLRVLARTILKRFGYQILEAASADEALHLCTRFSGPIHLLLTDVVMPKVSGRELAERLAVLRPDTRILFMSGYTDDTVLRHGVLDAGIAFLQKPITPDTLARKVREVLDAPEARPTAR